jgi:hypothetical protein
MPGKTLCQKLKANIKKTRAQDKKSHATREPFNGRGAASYNTQSLANANWNTNQHAQQTYCDDDDDDDGDWSGYEKQEQTLYTPNCQLCQSGYGYHCAACRHYNN